MCVFFLFQTFTSLSPLLSPLANKLNARASSDKGIFLEFFFSLLLTLFSVFFFIQSTPTSGARCYPNGWKTAKERVYREAHCKRRNQTHFLEFPSKQAATVAAGVWKVEENPFTCTHAHRHTRTHTHAYSVRQNERERKENFASSHSFTCVSHRTTHPPAACRAQYTFAA